MAIGEVDWYGVNADLLGELSGLVDLEQTLQDHAEVAVAGEARGELQPVRHLGLAGGTL